MAQSSFAQCPKQNKEANPRVSILLLQLRRKLLLEVRKRYHKDEGEITLNSNLIHEFTILNWYYKYKFVFRLFGERLRLQPQMSKLITNLIKPY